MHTQDLEPRAYSGGDPADNTGLASPPHIRRPLDTLCFRPLPLMGMRAGSSPELVEDTSLPSAPLSVTP